MQSRILVFEAKHRQEISIGYLVSSSHAFPENWLASLYSFTRNKGQTFDIPVVGLKSRWSDCGSILIFSRFWSHDYKYTNPEIGRWWYLDTSSPDSYFYILLEILINYLCKLFPFFALCPQSHQTQIYMYTKQRISICKLILQIKICTKKICINLSWTPMLQSPQKMKILSTARPRLRQQASEHFIAAYTLTEIQWCQLRCKYLTNNAQNECKCCASVAILYFRLLSYSLYHLMINLTGKAKSTDKTIRSWKAMTLTWEHCFVVCLFCHRCVPGFCCSQMNAFFAIIASYFQQHSCKEILVYSLIGLSNNSTGIR